MRLCRQQQLPRCSLALTALFSACCVHGVPLLCAQLRSVRHRPTPEQPFVFIDFEDQQTALAVLERHLSLAGRELVTNAVDYHAQQREREHYQRPGEYGVTRCLGAVSPRTGLWLMPAAWPVVGARLDQERDRGRGIGGLQESTCLLRILTIPHAPQ